MQIKPTVRGLIVNNNKILIIDDDEKILSFLKDFLKDFEFEIFTYKNGDEILEKIDSHKIDLALIDLRLNKESGLDIAKIIQKNRSTPIIMMSAITDDVEKIVGLESAIDDFIEKPFNPRLFVAKIRATLRRQQSNNNHPETVEEHATSPADYFFDDYKLDSKKCTLAHATSGYIEMTNTEFRLLELFVSHPNTIFPRDALLEKLGLESTTLMMRNIDVLVLRVRRKIELNPSRPKYLQTRRNRGYIFCLDSSDHCI